MKRRPFSPEEDAAIRAGYRRSQILALAARLGRTVPSVYHRAARLEIRTRNDRPKKGAEFEARVLALHRERRGCYETARRLRCSPMTVRAVLGRHGLVPLGRSSDTAREANRRAMLGRLARGEVPVNVRWRDRSPAPAYNLPPLSAQALEVLLALLAGPLTKRELCAATGRPWRGPKRSLRTHHGVTFTHNLKNLGLVVCTCRGLGRGTGKGTGKVYHYQLTPLALRLLAGAGKGGA